MRYVQNVNLIARPLGTHAKEKGQLRIVGNHSSPGGTFCVKMLGIEDGSDKLPLSKGDYLRDGWLWVNLFSYGYHVKMGSEWVTNSGGSKLLWLPPAWRTGEWKKVRWDGKFLAFLSGD